MCGVSDNRRDAVLCVGGRCSVWGGSGVVFFVCFVWVYVERRSMCVLCVLCGA